MTNQDYLEHAEECERFAAMAKMPANRRALLASAEMWRTMAADAKPGDGAAATNVQPAIVVDRSGQPAS